MHRIFTCTKILITALQTDCDKGPIVIQNAKLPLWLAFGSALLWGLWWMPVRALEGVGFFSTWAGTAMFLGALPILLILFFTGKRDTSVDTRALLSGALVGSAMMLYSIAITETTVVRSVLLFYLAPAWAIAIECMFMGRRFRPINALAFLFAGIGVVFIFRGEVTLSDWNSGDSMALTSGMCWAVGSTLVFTGKDNGARTLSLFACMAAFVVGLLMSVLYGHALPTPSDPIYATQLLAVSGALYITPVLIATLWSARRVNPTTLAFLLTGEIISGLATSAWFLSEPFGWPELIGATLVMSAALVEVFAPKSNSNI